MEVQVGVHFVVIERARVVGIGRQAHVVMVVQPLFVQTGRERHSFVVLQRVTGVGLGVEVVGTEVQTQVTRLPFQSFRQIEQLRAHVGLQSHVQVGTPFLSLDLHQTAGQVAVLYRGDAAHDLHLLDIIGRKRAHVDARIGEVAVGTLGVPCPTDILHVGIGGDGCTIDHKLSAQRRGHILTAARGCLTDMDHVWGAQRGCLRPSTGQQLQ